MQKLTKEQGIVITGFTGIMACDFGYFHQDLEERMGRPVWTHELGDKALWENEIKPLYKDDFLAMVKQ